MKDPLAIFSSEWLYRNYDFDMLVMIRHPAAFCSSLKIKGWAFDFNHILSQPKLMGDLLYPFKEQIKEYSENDKDIVDQAILLWNCIHYSILLFRERHSGWLFVKHEDLSLDPLEQFRIIYNKFNLEYTSRAQKVILESSGTHNPIEQMRGNEFKRNSKDNIKNWKNCLSEEEVNRVLVGTANISSQFYTDDDWR